MNAGTTGILETLCRMPSTSSASTNGTTWPTASVAKRNLSTAVRVEECSSRVVTWIDYLMVPRVVPSAPAELIDGVSHGDGVHLLSVQ